MSATSTASFVHSLQKHGIVSEERTDEIARTLQQRFADVRGLAKELVRRGYITAFQADLLLQGRGQELVVGPYRLLDRLGEGGMGEVFKARHMRMDRVVALKLIQKEHLAQPQAIERFFREARAAAQLSHPNIVIAHDAGEAEGIHFLAMEYVEGVDLARLVQQSGRLAIPLACDFIRQAALGLQHALEKGVVHRDIKPGNLLATKTGADGATVVKILDFGLARFESETGPKRNLTQIGKVVGTVDYISPEQAENARKADIRSDIYSLGCSLFYLLTGQPPFSGETGLERLSARLLGKPQSIRALRPEVPEGLEQVLGKMLARDPAMRFQTPAEVAAALKPFSKAGNVKAGSLGSVSAGSAAWHQAAPEGKSKAGTPGSVSGRTVAGDEVSGKSVAGKKQSSTAGPSSNPFASLQDEDKTSVKRSSPCLVVAKPLKPKAAGNKGLIAGLGIGGGLAAALAAVVLVVAVLAVVLVIVLTRGGGDGRKDVGAVAKGDDGASRKGKDQNTARENPPDTDQKNNKKDGPKADPVGVSVAVAPFPADQAKKHQQRWADQLKKPVVFTNSVKMKLTLIPPGVFEMGASNGDDNEKPPHRVTISKPFYLGVYEVTQAEYEAITGTNLAADKGATKPAQGMSWDEADAFCKELGKREGRVYRLPTEAEWEWACRAGTQTAWSFGNNANDIDDYAWHNGTSPKYPQPVGLKKPNPFGLYDMHGNVWEFCSDWYSDYTAEAVTDPRGPELGKARVFRGGSQYFPVWESRSSNRPDRQFPGRGSNLGFRALCEMPGPDDKLETPNAPPNKEIDEPAGKDGPKSVPPDPTPKKKEPISVAGDIVPKVKKVAGIELVSIPNGWFYMGSKADDKDAFANEKPRHKVTISQSFYLGKHKVTVGQFKRFVNATSHTTEAEKDGAIKTWKKPGFDQTDEHPVVWVSWDDADAFCRWLATEAGATVRLPREAEWEYSCRAKATTKFYFGDNEADLGDYAWYPGNTNAGTKPCGLKKPNDFGLHDMHGLVCEWCADGKRTYTDQDETDPEEPTSALRVCRGGSFGHSREWCRAACRNVLAPSARYGAVIGFRVFVGPNKDGPKSLPPEKPGDQPLPALGDGSANEYVRTQGHRFVHFGLGEPRVVLIFYDPKNMQYFARVYDLGTGQALTPPLKHKNLMGDAAFSPDGKRVVTTSSDQTARVWDPATGEARTPPLKHQGLNVFPAKFSPEGKRVVIATHEDKTARIWDAASGKELTPPLKHEGEVMDASFSPDGKRVVTASVDKTARVWDAATGKEVTPPLKHEELLYHAAFSPDGKWVVTASNDKTARVWDAATGDARTILKHEAAVGNAAFSPDGKRVVTVCSWDKTARVWDAATGQALTPPLRHEDLIQDAAFSPDGKWVVTASNDKTARVWDAATGDARTILKHEAAVGNAAFSPDGKRVVTVSTNTARTARLWDAETGKELKAVTISQIVATDPDPKKKEPLAQEPPAIPASTDPDRRAAEWVLSIGGFIGIKENGEFRQRRAVGDLPRGAFELTFVNLTQNRQVSDAGLANFKDCKNLTILWLPDIKVSDAGLAHFKDCKNLTDLYLDHAKVSDAGLAHFNDCKNLTSLRLYATQVSDAGLVHFRDCKNLRTLSLGLTKVSDVGLASFKGCKDLISLDLDAAQVSDAGLANFKDCKNLRFLGLNNTKVSDAGLAEFKDWKNLGYLRLNNTRVGDAGLAYLKDCKNLRDLDVRGTKASAAAVSDLQKALPKCKIQQ